MEGSKLGMEERGGEQNDGDQKPAELVWHEHARGDHATEHATIDMRMPFAPQGSKQKTNHVTWCRIENPTNL